jgi:plasmid stability protein
MKATFDLDDALYRAIKMEAARSDRSVRDVVAEALDRWLEALEATEDARQARLAIDEYERDGGLDAGQLFDRLAAEAKASYGSDPEP